MPSETSAPSSYLRRRRIIDTIVALIALPFALPVLSLLSCLIALVDHHRPLIWLERVGRGGTKLSLPKLQTMTPQCAADSGLVTSSSDRRVTALGRRLRAWRVDELPQLGLLLTGEMALVGPRPEDPSFVDLHSDDWSVILDARPGIAGLTQIIAAGWESENLGDNADAHYSAVALPAKVAIDRWYVENASLTLDAIVVAAHVEKFVLKRRTTAAHRLVAQRVPQAHVLVESV